MAKPKGIRGDWFAIWQGERLPCAHQCWSGKVGKRFSYLDPHVSGDPKWAPFIKAIEDGKRVILTTDDMANGEPVSRKGYVALFSVENVHSTNEMLSFDFSERLYDFT